VNAFRRSAVMLVIAAATLVGVIAAPAQAAFTDKTSTTTLTIGTATIAAPGDVAVQQTKCNEARTQYLTLSWDASTSRRVSGYLVTGFDRSGAKISTVQVASTTTSTTVTVDKQVHDAATLTYSVTTLTAYGWTAESAESGVITC
jgi:hypothetical protein